MIFIGYDENYQEQYDNCVNSIDGEVHPTPFVDRKGSTAFTFSRFLIPETTEYKGWHFFSDSDFLFLDDVRKLYELADDQYAVMVVKHPAYDVETIKMDGKPNSYYERKNWASLILWNSAHPANRILTKDYIMNAKPLDLLQFKWLKDSEIGELDPAWNVLVGHQEESGAKGLHFTNGINNNHYKDILEKIQETKCLVHVDYKLDKKRLLETAEMLRPKAEPVFKKGKDGLWYSEIGYEVSEYSHEGEITIIGYTDDYILSIMKDFGVFGKPKFLFVLPGSSIPEHVDIEKHAYASLNFILSDNPAPITYTDKNYFYESALINASIPHSVKNCSSERVMLKIDIATEKYESLSKRLPFKKEIL